MSIEFATGCRTVAERSENMLEIIKGGVTAAEGFEAAGAAASIKYAGRMDMALVYSEAPCRVAGTFTTNVVKAAPVVWDQRIVAGKQPVHCVIVNAGIANAATGRQGMEDCERTARKVAACLGIGEEAVLIGSTGVIGKQLPIDRIERGIEILAGSKAGSLEAGTLAAEAIMTTDTHSKEAAVRISLGGTAVTVGGMCKGSGMIHPDMCTMLGYVTTDAAISTEMLTKMVKEDVRDTFNMISVDGDTSTNDTLLVLANGLAGNAEITDEGDDYQILAEALRYVNESLAKMMAGDGEGATALFETKVVNAASKEDARLLAKSVIGSSLTKAAIFGHDANWGRILCALGYAGVDFDPERVDLFFASRAGRIAICRNGEACGYSEEEATAILSEPEVTVVVDMKIGESSATAWGCDLTYDYVRINADYRS